MVDEIVSRVVESAKPVPGAPPDGRGFELPLLLLGAFRSLIDDLHAELARYGHPQMRPAYGFALQAIGLDGATASELGRRLGITKQAAGKTVDRLEGLGYAERCDDETDGRRKVVRLTRRGLDVLARSAAIFQDLRAAWAKEIGAEKLADLEAILRTRTPADTLRVDLPGWFGP